jgi:hypothetical protein
MSRMRKVFQNVNATPTSARETRKLEPKLQSKRDAYEQAKKKANDAEEARQAEGEGRGRES